MLGKHSLEVPAGAVDAPTVFTMTELEEAMRFDLVATPVITNDIGAADFALTLEIDCTRASELPSDESILQVF